MNRLIRGRLSFLCLWFLFLVLAFFPKPAQAADSPATAQGTASAPSGGTLFLADVVRIAIENHSSVVA